MRWSWLPVLLFLPLAGCLGGNIASVNLVHGFRLPDGDAAPVAMHDCTQMLETMRSRALAEADTLLAQSVEGHSHGGWTGGGAIALEMAAADGRTTRSSAPGAAPPRAAEADVTGTNNQEASADEMDIMKTDGEWTYVLRGDRLLILHSEHVGDARLHATIALPGHGQGLLLGPGDPDDPSDDRLLVVDSQYREGQRRASSSTVAADIWYPGNPVAHVQVLALESRSRPQVLDEMWIDGSHVDARLVDGTAYLVVYDHARHLGLRTHAWPDEQDIQKRGLDWERYHRMSESVQKAVRADVAAEARLENRRLVAQWQAEDVLPTIQTGPERKTMVADTPRCRNIWATEGGTARGMNTIVALGLDGPLGSSVHHVTSGYPIVYGTSEALVLATPSRDAWWFWDNTDIDEGTDVQWFDLDGLDVIPRASGRIPGIVQDSFGIDVHDDQLRMATTTGQWLRRWMDEPEPMVNHVAVLKEVAGQLVLTGLAGPLAPGERIWSARFTDDRAYIVTFEQIDPLWIIDLSDPERPLVLGELEIPGVSTYIHPVSDDLLLTVGMGPRQDGVGLDWSRFQMSLFDISDPTAPRRADLLELSPASGHAWSGALHEHKAITYWDRLGLVAVPLDTQESYQTMENNRRYTEYRHHATLRLIEVDQDAKRLVPYGTVDQDALRDDQRDWRSSIERSYFLGFPDTGPVSVYALSGLGMTAHDLEDLSLQASVSFPYDEPRYHLD